MILHASWGRWTVSAPLSHVSESYAVPRGTHFRKISYLFPRSLSNNPELMFRASVVPTRTEPRCVAMILLRTPDIVKFRRKCQVPPRCTHTSICRKIYRIFIELLLIPHI